MAARRCRSWSATISQRTVTPNDRVVLEAIIIADGSRPSFLIENDTPPLSHPVHGQLVGRDRQRRRMRLKPICAAVGRIQPRFGHAGNFIGTGSLVDAEKGIIAHQLPRAWTTRAPSSAC